MHLRRLLLLFGAAVSFLGAAVLILSAGLPQRATYTGYVIPGETRRAAPETGALAPPFTLESAAGDMVNLSDLRGEPVVINFWATWCAPCRAEMPELQALADQHDTLHVLGVNGGEGRAAVRAWARSLGLDFPLLLDRDQSVAERYALRGYPSTYIVGPDGVIREIYYGTVSAGQLMDNLSPYLPQDGT